MTVIVVCPVLGIDGAVTTEISVVICGRHLKVITCKILIVLVFS